MLLQYYITTNTFSVNKPINMAIYVYESGKHFESLSSTLWLHGDSGLLSQY